MARPLAESWFRKQQLGHNGGAEPLLDRIQEDGVSAGGWGVHAGDDDHASIQHGEVADFVAMPPTVHGIRVVSALGRHSTGEKGRRFTEEREARGSDGDMLRTLIAAEVRGARADWIAPKAVECVDAAIDP
jgi:hypothetical protein